ncbi:unnamed protein product [Ceratitis capitata]|uniref:(Mediterranean fruit fly) hypothetical protein n=1 Tax=Ceratitis capitata TaxID=7213 RepID=A0A811V731_CERCA|nr:unnamed protein product [Ceratitis capitata]
MTSQNQSGSHQQKTHYKRKLTSQRNTVLQPVIATRIPSILIVESRARQYHHTSRRPSTSAVTTRQLVSRHTEGRAHKQTQSNLKCKRDSTVAATEILMPATDFLPDPLTGEPSYFYIRDIDVNNYLRKEARQLT